jgi:V/A-type H+-transporting ATPase subunit I
MYGAPNSQESDPMPVLAPFYMILFGMMLSDVGYGSMLVIMTAYMLFKKKVEGTLRQLSSMLFISGIASVVWGFVFGGFFGDLVTVVSQGKANFPMLWFNPMDSPTQLLLFSMVFGVIHLFFGMALKIRNEKLKGNLMGGLGETVPWYLIIPGLGLLLGKGSLTSEPQTALLLSDIGKGLVIAGVAFALIFAGHGIRNPFKRLMKGLGALYGITSWLSDILSYSRILALVLATSVIAAVVNMLGMLFGPTVFGYVAFTLIGVFGHTLNLGLSALSAFVHTSRLQYVELFGKFFEGGGSFWNPLRRRTEYVRIDKNAGDSVPDS